MLTNKNCFSTSKNLSSKISTINVTSKKVSQMNIVKKFDDSFDSEDHSSSDDSVESNVILKTSKISESLSIKQQGNSNKDILIIAKKPSNEANILFHNLQLLKKLKSNESKEKHKNIETPAINFSSDKQLEKIQQVRKNLKFSEDFSKFKTPKVSTTPLKKIDGESTIDNQEKLNAQNKTQSINSGTTQHSNFHKLAFLDKANKESEFILSQETKNNKEINLKSQFQNKILKEDKTSKNTTTQKNLPYIIHSKQNSIFENKISESLFKSSEDNNKVIKDENQVSLVKININKSINNNLQEAKLKSKKQKKKINCSFFNCFK